MKPGLYTLETIAKERNITLASAKNYLTKLRKEKRVERIGKIYKIHKTKIIKDNGMYSILDSTPVKIHRNIIQQVHGKQYTIEQAIVEALEKGDSRHLAAVAFLCNRQVHWPTLVRELKKKNLLQTFMGVYNVAKKSIRVRRIPKRYQNIQPKSVPLNKEDIWSYT